MAETKKAEAKTEAKEKLVKIKLPLTERESGDVYVGINERDWLIKRGVEVEVPECVYEVLRQSEAADEAAMMRRIELQK